MWAEGVIGNENKYVVYPPVVKWWAPPGPVEGEPLSQLQQYQPGSRQYQGHQDHQDHVQAAPGAHQPGGALQDKRREQNYQFFLQVHRIE